MNKTNNEIIILFYNFFFIYLNDINYINNFIISKSNDKLKYKI